MSLEESLAAVEQLIEQVSAALLAADPSSLEKHSAALRDAAAQFAHVLEQASPRGQPLPPALQKRIRAIDDMLAVHRESLARLSVNTERQVAGLVPQAANPATYGDGRGAPTGRPGVARIYKSTS